MASPRVEAIASGQGHRYLRRAFPWDPKISAEVDAGKAEDIEGDWYKGVAGQAGDALRRSNRPKAILFFKKISRQAPIRVPAYLYIHLRICAILLAAAYSFADTVTKLDDFSKGMKYYPRLCIYTKDFAVERKKGGQ